tara:strand:+ start:9889 stop:10206 length:318 start_codon:yes stop_codon:yes gene_type:complete
MPKGVAGSRMIGSSSRFTNNTCVLGSLPGLAPTTNMRPNITGLAGYKAYPISNNMFRIVMEEDQNGKVSTLLKRSTNAVSECESGFTKGCKDSKTCVNKVNKVSK